MCARMSSPRHSGCAHQYGVWCLQCASATRGSCSSVHTLKCYADARRVYAKHLLLAQGLRACSWSRPYMHTCMHAHMHARVQEAMAAYLRHQPLASIQKELRGQPLNAGTHQYHRRVMHARVCRCVLCVCVHVRARARVSVCLPACVSRAGKTAGAQGSACAAPNTHSTYRPPHPGPPSDTADGRRPTSGSCLSRRPPPSCGSCTRWQRRGGGNREGGEIEGTGSRAGGSWRFRARGARAARRSGDARDLVGSLTHGWREL